jgi:hypothetical protein
LSSKLDVIRDQFVSDMNDDDLDTMQVLSKIVHAVKDEQGISLHDAAAKVAHWAVDEGFVPASLESLAADEAEACS